MKIGQSMNVAHRVDSFKFEELIGMTPFPLNPWHRTATGRPDEHREDHALAVQRELMNRERAIHGRLASRRVVSGRRANPTSGSGWTMS